MKNRKIKLLPGRIYTGRVQFLDGFYGSLVGPDGKEYKFHLDRYRKAVVRDGVVEFFSEKRSKSLPRPELFKRVIFVLGWDEEGRLRVHKFGPYEEGASTCQ